MKILKYFMKRLLCIAMIVHFCCTNAESHDVKKIYKTFISPSQAVKLNGGIITHEHYLTFNFKKKGIKEPGRPLLESKTSYSMFDNFIAGLEPKNNIPADPDEIFSAVYELDKSWSPGKFFVLLNVWNFRYAKKSTSKFSVEVNGKSISYDFPFMEGEYKGKGYKWVPFVFDTENQIREFTVRLSPPPVAPFIIKRIFITNQEEDIIKIKESKGDLQFSLIDENPFSDDGGKVKDARMPDTRNLVLGSDFETGGGLGWRSLTSNYLYNERTYGSSEGFQSSHSIAPVGAMGENSSLRSMTLTSNLIPVKKTGKYVLSFYARTDSTDNPNISSQVRSGNKYYRLESSKEWRRYSHELELKSGRVTVAFILPEGTQLDRVQLEKNELTSYSQALSVEVGAWFFGSHTHAYRIDEPIPVNLMVSVRDRKLEKSVIWAEMIDFYGKSVWREEFVVLLKNGVGFVKTDLQKKTPGIFRLLLGVKGEKDYIAESVFTNHLSPEKHHKKYPSAIGFYSALSHSSLENLSKSGMDHAISFSCFPQTGHWQTVGIGPSARDLIFYDEYVDLCNKYNVELTVNIDYRPRKNSLKWMQRRKGSNVMPADMSDWKFFLQTIMKHYGSKVSSWLILDDLSHYFSSAEYKEFVDIAKEVHDKTVPDSNFIAWIYNFPNPYFDKKLSQEESDRYGKYFSEVTDALFMAEKSWNERYSGKKEIRRYFHGGAGDSIYQKNSTKFNFFGNNAKKIDYYKKAVNPTIKRAIREFSYYKIDRFQYYSARTPPDNKSIYHFDGTFTPAGHAFSVLNYYMRGKKMFKNHLLPGIELNEFRDNEGRAFFTLWSSSGEPVELWLPIAPSGLEIRNLTGGFVYPQKIKNGSTLLIKSEILYMRVNSNNVEKLFSKSVLNNITPFAIFLTPGKSNRHLQLNVEVRNRTENAQNLVMHFEPIGIDWKSGQGDFHDDLQAVIKNYNKVLKPGNRDRFTNVIRYVPGQEYVLRNIRTVTEWMGERSTVNTQIKAAYASRINEKKELTADMTGLIQKNRFNRIGGIDLSVRYPAAQNEVDVRCFPRWDSKNIYFTTRILSKGFVLGNPRNTLRLYLDSQPVENWYLPIDKKTFATVTVDLNKGTAVLKKQNKTFNLDCKLESLREKLIIEWAVPWRHLDLKPPASNQLHVIGMNYSFLTASAAEEYYYSWLSWYDRSSLIPNSYGYLILGY
jgi:hypothetical protein